MAVSFSEVMDCFANARRQSKKWWDIICDDDSFDPYTDDDQLLQSKHK